MGAGGFGGFGLRTAPPPAPPAPPAAAPPAAPPPRYDSTHVARVSYYREHVLPNVKRGE
jgi:hypothetical protein